MLLTKYNTGNIDKFLNDIEKYSIGMDEWFNRFDTVHESTTNYPPYNLIKESETEFRLELALAGYKKEDIRVYTEWNKLSIEAVKKEKTQDTVEYLHNGLAKRAFTRTWTLSDDVKVSDVKFEDGLLVIKLNRVIPEHQKRKVYEIL
jgi:molecular chaperone IbpA